MAIDQGIIPCLGYIVKINHFTGYPSFNYRSIVQNEAINQVDQSFGTPDEFLFEEGVFTSREAVYTTSIKQFKNLHRGGSLVISEPIESENVVFMVYSNSPGSLRIRHPSGDYRRRNCTSIMIDYPITQVIIPHDLTILCDFEFCGGVTNDQHGFVVVIYNNASGGNDVASVPSYTVSAPSFKSKSNSKQVAWDRNKHPEECDICFESLSKKKVIKLHPGNPEHVLCTECFHKLKKKNCPFCRRVL